MPNVEMALPLTAYYGITLLSLHVGKSGITSCVLRIGSENFEFKTGDSHTDKTVLWVNGATNYTPTHRLLSENEKIMLVLPKGVGADIGNEELLLHHYLSYSVPTT